jgi:hypothetical protein
VRRRRLRAADGARLAAERVREALAKGLLWSFETPSGDGKVNVKGAWTQSLEEREGFLHQLVVDLYGLATELDGTTITPDRLEPKFEDRGAEIEIGASGPWQDTQVLYVHYKLDRETDPTHVPILSYVYISEPLPTPQVAGVRQPSAFQTSILINVPDPERPLEYTRVTGFEGRQRGVVVNVWQDELGYFYNSRRGKIYLPQKP